MLSSKQEVLSMYCGLRKCKSSCANSSLGVGGIALKRRSSMCFYAVVLTVVVCLMLGQVQAFATDAIIDMSFRQAEVEDVFRAIAKAGGMNLLTGRDVSGKVTLDLENVSLMTALDTVARLTGLAYVVIDDIVIVATPATIEEQFTDKYFTVYEPKGIGIQDAAEIARMILSSGNVTVVGNRLVMHGTDLQFEILKDILSQVDAQREEVLTFDDATVFDLLRAISIREGYALVVEPQIADSKVTMDIGMIDSASALDILSEWYGLDYELENGILKVRRRPGLPGVAAGVLNPDLASEMSVVSVISTHYIRAGEIKGMIEKLYPAAVIVETVGEHMTVVKGSAWYVEEIAGLVREMDKPSAQVMVEVRVQEVSLNALEELGLSWTLPIISAGREEGQAQALSVNYSNFEVALNALVQTGKSKLLARPSISSIEGEKARVFIGDRIPIVLKSTSEEGTSESISYFESGVMLEITPEVISDGLITLVVESQISTITGYTSDNHPKIRTRETQTKVRVADGQPIVIGGLLKQEDVSEDEGVPFLRRLPIIGSLFKSNKTTGQTMETLIFLTPRLVTPTTEVEVFSDEEPRKAKEILEQELAKLKDEKEYPFGLSIDVVTTDSFDIEAEVMTGESIGLLFRGYTTNRFKQNLGVSGLGFGIGLRRYASDLTESVWVDLFVDRLSINTPGEGNAVHYFIAPRIGYRLSVGSLSASVYARYGFMWDQKSLSMPIPGRSTGLSVGCQVGVWFN